MSFWRNAANYLVLQAINERFAREQLDFDRELTRYADYRDGRPQAVLKYFLKRPRETDARFTDRPKRSFPLCRLFVDAHAEALAKEVKVSIGDEDPRANEFWREVHGHNDLDSFYRVVAQTLGVYGSSVVRPAVRLDEDGKAWVEFDSFTPLEAKLLYESSGAGSSVKRFVGVAIQTGYSLMNGELFPREMIGDKPELVDQLRVVLRTEFISRDRWVVWLDDAVTPVSPFGQAWMPTEDGANPYRFNPAVLFNALETEESFLGISDINQSCYDVQDVNELYSDVIYAHRLCVPIPKLTTKDANLRGAFTLGLGTGVAVGPEEDFEIVSGQMNFTDYVKPMEVALQLCYSNAKLPAIAVGMGRTLGGGLDTSGEAKFYEWMPTVAHAKAKRAPFSRGMRQLVKNAMRIAAFSDVAVVQGRSYRLGLRATGLNPDMPVAIAYADEIVPVSQAERLQRYGTEVLKGFSAIATAIGEYRGWSPERVHYELDLIEAEKNRAVSGLSMREVVAAVEERQNRPIDKEAVAAAADSVLKAPQLGSDQFGNEEDNSR